MKKFMFLAFLLTVAFFALAACGGNGETPADDGATPPPVETPAPTEAPPDGGGEEEPGDDGELDLSSREAILARAATMTAVPGSYIINAHATRPEANILDAAWSNAQPNAHARMLMFAGELNTMARNHFNEFFPNPVVSVDGAWPTITDQPNGDRTYTFTIYTDLRFSDGSPITAHHFAGGVALNISSYWDSVVPSANGFLHVAYRTPWINGDLDVIPSIRIYNDSQFSITYAAEFLPNVWEAGSNMNHAPVALHMFGVEAHDDGDGVFLTALGGGELTNEALSLTVMGGAETFVQFMDADGELMYNEDGNPVGEYFSDGIKYRPTVFVGPYMFESVDVGNGVLTLVANPHFPGTWDGYRPRIERVIWRLTPSPVMVDAVASGAAHIMENIQDGEALENALNILVGGGTHDFVRYDQFGQLFTQFHTDTGPTQFREVRAAIAYLQDRHEMNEMVGRGFTVVAHGPWAPAWWWYQEAANRDLYERVTIYDLNIARAIELLEEGGWVYDADGNPYEGNAVDNPDNIRHKWVDEWEWGTGDDGEIVRIYTDEDGNMIRSNKVYTGERVLMPLEINWMVRAIAYPFRDQLEIQLFDNLAYAGGRLIQERSDLWSGALSSGYAFAGGRFEMHTLGIGMALVWSPWVQASLEAIPSQNWGQIDSPTMRALADNIRGQDISTDTGRDAFIEAFIDYMEYLTYQVYTLPFNMALVHDFFPTSLSNWYNTGVWGFPQAVLRSYWQD